MGYIAIAAEGLGKRYRIGGSGGQPGNLRESIMNAAAWPGRALRKALWHRRGALWACLCADAREFWALRDVSFEVRHGEVLGIIGRNGAGKSTLLKVLARITEPTLGRARVFGRVGSLLEVGSGFHPELTGRDNVFLNGAILGMKREEIRSKFDEIVAFAEVEKFIDTPVKHYSSGMYLRLAFAVAAHLNPEILFIDEVLAVGDASFQMKCLGKMGEVSRQGRTIIFVSHNMAAIQKLCTSAIHLKDGRIVKRGPTMDVVQEYLRELPSSTGQSLADIRNRSGRGRVRFTSFHLEDENRNPVGEGTSGRALAFVAHYQSEQEQTLRGCRVSFAVSDWFGNTLFLCSSELTVTGEFKLPPSGVVRCTIPRLPLSRGRYGVAPFFEVNREIEDWLEDGVTFDVVDSDFYGTGRLYPPGWDGRGVLVPHRWESEGVDKQEYDEFSKRL